MTDQPASIPSARPEAAIRYRIAAETDVDAIHHLIVEAARTTTVLPRSRESIQSLMANFIVAERDGAIIGCGALTTFTAQLAEVRSLVVADGLRGLGVGGGVVRALVELARARGAKRVFALTDNPGFFLRHGFSLTSKATLPHKVWNECVFCPKYMTCTEEAVDMFLVPGAAAEPGVITLEEPDTPSPAPESQGDERI